MKKDTIKITRLENIGELKNLKEGEVYLISVGEGEIWKEDYYGPAIFTGKSNEGFDFCRPQANLVNCMVGYNLPKGRIKINPRGVICCKIFQTYGYKHDEFLKNSGLK